MENNNIDLYRMYGFVPYNISEIQKGIQFGHGVVEYANKYFNTNEYKQWSKYDKTFIILSGGTTNNSVNGTMQDIKNFFVENKYNYSEFCEPDMNDALTSVNILVADIYYKKEYNLISFMDFCHKYGCDNLLYKAERENVIFFDFKPSYDIIKDYDNFYEFIKKQRVDMGKEYAYLKNRIEFEKLANNNPDIDMSYVYNLRKYLSSFRLA